MGLRKLVAESPNRNLSREQMLALRPKKEYKDGRTQKAFTDETDINKIMQRAQKTGTISHISRFQARYGDFSDFDFHAHQIKITEGREMFDLAPSEIRREFNNDPAEFFAYVNDPENKDRLHELLPGLAKPGRQNIDVTGRTNVQSEPIGDPPKAEPSPAEPPAEPPPDLPPSGE